MISSFPFYKLSDGNPILGTIPGVASLMKQGVCTQEKSFWKLCIPFSSLPISEIYIEKIKLLQENRLGLWDVLENCERKGSLDVHKKSKENDFQSLFRVFTFKNNFNGKESHRYFIEKIDYK
jgi:hypoxanthine-DNA glycosylase